MTVAGVTKWLDRLAKTTKQRCAIGNYSKELRLCEQLTHSILGEEMPYVHISCGLHEAAKLLDLDVNVLYENDDDMCVYFLWKGVMFIQLDNKEDKK